MKIVVVVLAFCLAPVSAFAQGFELTPFALFGTGSNFNTVDQDGHTHHGSFADSGGFGIAIDYVSTPDTRMGLYLSRQSSRYSDRAEYGETSPEIGLDIDYYHYEGKVLIPRSKRSVPYIELSVGATNLRPEKGDSALRFSAGFGGGWMYEMSRSTALRFDARILTTAGGTYGAIACTPGFCSVQATGSYFAQFVATAGLTFRAGY